MLIFVLYYNIHVCILFQVREWNFLNGNRANKFEGNKVIISKVITSLMKLNNEEWKIIYFVNYT